MKYFNQPPEIPLGRPTGNQPRFIKRWYKGEALTVAYILDLFRWAELEYNDVKAWTITRRNKDLYLRVMSVNPLYILAKSKEFRKIIDLMDSNVWESIPSVIKESLEKAYKIYSSSSLQ